MNFTGNINSSWQRFKLRYIAAAGGLAVAVSAVLTSTPWDRSPDAAAPAIAEVPAVARSQTQFDTAAGAAGARQTLRDASTAGANALVTSQTYIYVVGSEQEAVSLEAAIVDGSQEAADGSVRTVMVVDSEQAERDYQIMLMELLEAGAESGVTIVDLR